MKSRNKYHFYRKELSKLLKEKENISFFDDELIVDRIINLLSENKSVEKIKGIISTTEIVKYGGDISDEIVKEVYSEITEWWKKKQ